MREASHPIGIVGAGSVGTILAAHFEQLGRRTILVESGPRHDEIERDGVRVTGLVDISARPWRMARSLEALAEEERRQPRFWCICTKTWSIPALLSSLRHIGKEAIVVSVQNGLGAEEMLASAVGPNRVACAAVNFAGGHAQDGSAVRLAWFNPPNHVGVCNGDTKVARELSVLFTDAGLRTDLATSREIHRQLFYKMVLSAGLNALCALTGITMRDAMSMPHTRALARTLLSEALEVGREMGHIFAPDALDHAMSYLDQGGDHLPSMAVDLARGNPTEIEYINGKIVELGAQFPGVSVAANSFLTSMIVTMEIKAGTRPPSQVPPYLVPDPTRGAL